MTKTDLSRLLTEARAALAADRPVAALAILEPLVTGQPGRAEVHLQRALSLAALDDVDAAREAFATARALAPTEPVVWMEETLFEAARGEGGRMAKAARRAGLPKALVAMVVAAATGQGAGAVGTGAAARADMGRLAKAVAARDTATVERLAAPLIRTRPGAAIWALLGQARLDAGRPAHAVEAFRQGLRLEPYAVDLRLGLARGLAAQGDGTGALGQARRATQLAPRLATAWLTFGRLALRAGLAERALAAAETALEQAKRSDAALTLMAEAALSLGRPDRAITAAEARKDGAEGRALLLAEALRLRGRIAEAIDVLTHRLEAVPDDADALVARGQLRQSSGEEDNAEADLRAALEIAPSNGTAARALAYGTRLAEDDPAVGEMRAALDRADLRAEDRRAFDYALARALQSSDPAAAAGHLARANAAMLQAFPYDPTQMRQDFERSRGPLWAAVRRAMAEGAESACTAAPIFVTGLPRSGTTLVEAILSAHPDVVAGGELAVLRRAILPLQARMAEGATPTSDDLTAAGEAYRAGVALRFADGPGDRRVTDKSIYSFLEIGLIRAILPHARIVVVTRDPRDTGLSIWRNHFRDGTHRYAASQSGIADQIELFRDAVSFWEGACPGAVHRIDYDHLLDDPEGQSRALLQAAGLEWDPAVLDFHRQGGEVQTLSFAQVRQPLYRSSKGGWERNAEEIAELLSELEARGLIPDEA